MIVMFQRVEGDAARVVDENGVTYLVPSELLDRAGLRHLRTGQRLVMALDTHGQPERVRLP